MSVLGYLIIAIARVLSLVINIYTMVIVVAALISWVNPDPYNPIVKILYGLTNPAFRFVRRLLPNALLRTRIDISPMILLILLIVIETAVTGVLTSFGRGLLH